MSTPPLALSNLIDISVTVAPAALVASGFNQGLFVGPSTVIPSYGSNPRLRQYASTTAMLTAGFISSDPEVIAAGLYFSQTPAPQFIWIGRQDGTAIQTATIATGEGGTGYVVGDQVTVVQGGASFGVLTVLSVNAGVVVTLGTTVGKQGTGYTVANNLSTTGGTGTGLEVDITVVGETLLQASQACRAASNAWYGLVVNNPVDADNLALSEWADPLWQTTRYYPWTNDTAVLNGTAANLALQLQTLQLRVLGTYATTQSGLFPNNIYAAAAVMGVEMGSNTGLAGSFFSTGYKQLVGVAPEPLTQTQYTNIINAGFNVYGFFGPYQSYQPGVMSNGAPSYLWLNLAVLVANLQIDIVNVLQSMSVVPQTNAGQHLLLQGANTACANSASIGFLAGSTWEGNPVLSLDTGDSLPSGYLNQSPPYSQQSSADRDAGQAMPIYCTITTAGAVRSLTIGVYTQL
jgi:Protein of unknown function (DUF3383)